MGAANKVPFRGTSRNNPPEDIDEVVLAKAVQRNAANDAFRGNNKSTQKGKGPTKRPLRPKPTDFDDPEDRMGIMPISDKFRDPDGNRYKQPLGDYPKPPPKDDYFAKDRFNQVQRGEVNLSRNERGNIEATPFVGPLPSGRNQQRNAAENRMRRGGRKGGRR